MNWSLRYWMQAICIHRWIQIGAFVWSCEVCHAQNIAGVDDGN
jgi:hypothetical protein